MFVIKKSITHEEVMRTNDRKEVDRFIKECADDWNYGLFRYWKPNDNLELCFTYTKYKAEIIYAKCNQLQTNSKVYTIIILSKIKEGKIKYGKFTLNLFTRNR